jgi:hypothetical protein
MRLPIRLIVKWTVFAMINAEELGITSKNIDQACRRALRRDRCFPSSVFGPVLLSALAVERPP